MRYWRRGDSVESYSFDVDIEGAVEISKEEFDRVIANLPKPIPEPNRLDLLEKRVEALEEHLTKTIGQR